MITMYNSISGILSGKTASGAVCQALVDNQGIEWVLEVSRTCLMELPETGASVRLLCFLVVREDTQYLAGFHREEERRLFLDLMKVEGIGAKQALKILSGMRSDSIAALLEQGDVDGLERIPGLGKKTAQKMVLALKGKLTLDEAVPGRTAAGNRDNRNLGEHEDIAQALVSMGYDRKSVVTVLEELIPQVQGLDKSQREQELLRRAIMGLS